MKNSSVGSWQKYPENKPEFNGFYWVTARTNIHYGSPSEGITLHAYSYVELAFCVRGVFYDPHDHQQVLKNKVTAFMRIKEPLPFEGENHLWKELPPDIYGERPVEIANEIQTFGL
jgi:hypothetical protein